MSEPGLATTTAPTARPRRAARWVWVLLTISLAANLLVAGALAGSVWLLRVRPPVEGAGLSANIGGFVRSLPKERRRAILEQAGDRKLVFAQLRTLRDEMRNKRREALVVLTAEPYDAARFTAAHEEAVAAEDKLRRLSADLFVRFAGTLSPEERQAFARWRERHPRGGPRRGDRDAMDRDMMEERGEGKGPTR